MTKAFSFTATAKALALVPLMSSRQITVAPLGLPDIKTAPGEIALDRMVVRAVGELAQVSQAAGTQVKGSMRATQ
jgi:hypothetical protein